MGEMFGCAFLGRGFRPFFLMGAVYAAAMVPLWVYRFHIGALASGSFEDPVAWHGHEMVYGFVLAIVTGFLLTAVANWTAGAPVRGAHLAVLCGLWLAGRVAMNAPLPLWLAGTIDLLFLPALVVSLARPLWAARNVRNFVFLGMLGILFGLDLWMVLGGNRLALYFAILVIGAMIAVVGGRIVPAFTVAALRRRGLAVFMTDQPFMDYAAALSLGLLAGAWAGFGIDHPLSGIVACAAAGIHLWRMRLWCGAKALGDPMLWVLHLGYAWLVFALGLFGWVGLSEGGLLPSVALHALTTGAIGTMTIGMMVRVALGHTGRALEAGIPEIGAFLLMQAAALLRFCASWSALGDPTLWLAAAAACWSGAFLIYLVRFSSILCTPRPDGQEA